MLQYLRIENLALLKEMELEFGPGLIAVTGETGAGKSVLLGALRLLSGTRAEKTLIRQGADQLLVEAALHFADTTGLDSLLEELGLPACEDGQLLLRRTLAREKSARVQVNGALTTLASLSRLGEEWIDFHGPGEPQKLLRESWQLELLDLYARNGPERVAYGEAYGSWRKASAQIARLRGQEQLDEDEAAFLRAQVEKIDAANLSEESVALLESEFARMDRAEDLLRTAGSLAEGLGGEEGLAGRLGEILPAARELEDIDPELAALSRRLESSLIELEDLAGEYRHVAESADSDPERAQEVREAMEEWLALKRKYGPEVESVLAKREELSARLESQGDIEATLERLCAAEKAARKRVRETGAALRASREKAAKGLAREALRRLRPLGFPRACLEIAILPEDGPRAHGDSRARILFSPHAGQEPLPLDRIASSGETARVLLALKSVLARVDKTPVLVFDEVDANVGGEIATAVAVELGGLGREGHQVFCVTHLPQVAARAPSHFVVEKAQSTKATTVTIGALGPDSAERLEELARMLGDRSSSSARQHARELLDSPA